MLMFRDVLLLHYSTTAKNITTLVYMLVSAQIETSNCPGGIKDLSKQILEEG